MPAILFSQIARERVKTLRDLVVRVRASPEAASGDLKSLCDEAVVAADACETLAAENDGFADYIANTANKLDGERISNKVERKYDVFRILVAFIPGTLALLSPALFPNYSPLFGWMAIVVGMVFAVAIIAAVSIRSDTTYTISEKVRRPLHMRPFFDKTLGWYAYQALPSYLSAVPVVTSIFLAVLFGFGALFSTHPCIADKPCYKTHPFASSFLTLATFEGPPEGLVDAVSSLVVMELGCAVILTIGILGLLINRMSSFE